MKCEDDKDPMASDSGPRHVFQSWDLGEHFLALQPGQQVLIKHVGAEGGTTSGLLYGAVVVNIYSGGKKFSDPEHGSLPTFCYLSGVLGERKTIASRRSIFKNNKNK